MFEIIRCLHTAFRRDTREIDALAFRAAREGGDFTPILDRMSINGEFLDYHAKGEELAIFPAIERLAPFVAPAYVLDHRELDTMVAGLEAMRNANDPLSLARATAVLNAHLRIHLNKEDMYVYPFLKERIDENEHVSILGIMARAVPPDRMPTLVRWLIPLLGQEDQAVVTRIWMTLMPPPVFDGLKPVIREAAGKDWPELTRRVPGLE
jgi:hypothetical protein